MNAFVKFIVLALVISMGVWFATELVESTPETASQQNSISKQMKKLNNNSINYDAKVNGVSPTKALLDGNFATAITK